MPDADPNKTVFISYRRRVSSFIARAIFLDLRAHGYDVFMDVESIDSGTFDTIILNQIEARAHFIVILTPGTLERCIEPDDWLRREIEYAIQNDRNIVPILIGEFKFDSKSNEYLSGRLTPLPRYNALTLPHEYFDAAMEKLRTRFLKQPLVGKIRPTPPGEQLIVEQKIVEVASKSIPSRAELSAEEFFYRAYSKAEDTDVTGAIGDYSTAIELKPDFVDAYYNRGIMRGDSGDLNGAIVDFSYAIRLRPDDIESYYNRGLIQVRKGRWDIAIQDFSKVILLKPDHAEAYNDRGVAYRQLGDLNQAIMDYSEAIHLRDGYAEAYYNRAIAREGKRDWQGAIGDYSESIWIRPDDADAYFNRGIVRQTTGDFETALADFDEAIRLKQDGEFYYQRATVRRKMGDVEGAESDNEKAKQLKPASTDESVMLPRNNLVVGRMPPTPPPFDNHVQSSVARPFGSLERQRVKPKDAIDFIRRGLARFRRNHGEKALEDLNKAIQMSPEVATAQVYIIRAEIQLTAGDTTGALSDINEAIRLEPYNMEAYILRGLARSEAGDMNGALSDIDAVLRVSPERLEAYNARGLIYMKTGDYLAAISDFSRNVQIEPYHVGNMINRAEANFALGQYGAALQDFRRANGLRPNYPMTLAGLAITHHALGNTDEAQRLWRGLIDKDPRYCDPDWVKTELNWVDPLVEAARALIASL